MVISVQIDTVLGITLGTLRVNSVQPEQLSNYSIIIITHIRKILY